jgi:hypothetical protein
MTAFRLQDLGLVRVMQGNLLAADFCPREAVASFPTGGAVFGVIRRLEGFAQLAAAQGEAARGTRLFGAAEKQRGTHDLPLNPVDRADYVSLISLRAMLGTTAFTLAWAEGQAMTVEQAIEYALKNEG